MRSLPLVIDGRDLHLDLIEMDLEDFDMILAMDFLAKYGATIDCKNKLVTFETMRKEHFVFQDSRQKSRIPLVSESHARDLLNEGCT